MDCNFLNFILTLIFLQSANSKDFNYEFKFCQSDETLCGICGVCTGLSLDGKQTCEKKYFLSPGISPAPIIFTESCEKENLCNTGKYCNSANSNCYDNFGSVYCLCNKTNVYGQTCDYNLDGVRQYDYVGRVLIMYSPQAQIGHSTRFMIAMDYTGPGMELHVDLGLGVTYIQDIDAMIIGTSKINCILWDVTSKKFCNYLLANFESSFLFEVEYPMNRQTDNKDAITDILNKQFQFGRRYDISVKVYNYNNISGFIPLTFSWIYTKILWTENFGGQECTPKVNIDDTYCSTDGNRRIIYRSQSRIINSVVSPGEDDCSVPILRRWDIWNNVTNFRESNPKYISTLYEDNVKNLVINAFSYLQGRYLVKLHGRMKNKNYQLHNFKYCTFEIGIEPLQPIIKGGSNRQHFYKQNIKLDASQSYDPNEKPDSQPELIFTWSCQLNETMCNQFITTEKVRKISGPFGLNKTYKFELILSTTDNTKLPGRTTQIITITDKISSGLYIKCWKNCAIRGYNSTIYEIVYLEAVPGKASTVTAGKESYTWSYSVNKGNDLDVAPIRQPDTPDYILIVELEKLTELTEYSFTVSGLDGSDASFDIYTSQNPLSGECHIEPKEGIMGETMFTISCSGFTSFQKDQILFYEFYDTKPTLKNEDKSYIISSSRNIKNSSKFGKSCEGWR